MRERLINSLKWKLNRVRVMGWPEVIWRAKQTVHAKLERWGFGIIRNIPDPNGTCGKPWVSCFPSPDAKLYIDAADLILQGCYSIFSKKSVMLGFPPQWNRDPRTGRVAPLHFGKTLNYRDENVVGDIKYLWEPNRHLELVTLAQAYVLTSDMRYAIGVRTLLKSWFEQCPYPLGPNWTSSLEHAVRIVNWSVTWHLLGGESSPLFQGRDGSLFKSEWYKNIYLHLCFIRGHFSRYSSANNHLLGEYMGLLIGSITWPLWDESQAWIELAQKGFEREALTQNAGDGVNREQATWYHHEVADMMLLCGLFARANGRDFSEGYWQRLDHMLEFIAAMMDVRGNIPMIGDSDDAVMVRFLPANLDAYCSLLATGAVLFQRPEFRVKAKKFDDKSLWLLGERAEQTFNSLGQPVGELSLRRAFSEGGYWILGSDLDCGNEVRLVADAGPLGYLSIAAHGHADALSFFLSVGGKEILIDTGTYAYHTQKIWRDYFRGTSAHNTVRVDYADQSVAAGNFLWITHAKAKCLAFRQSDSEVYWEGEHDGYRRFSDPVMHRRSINYDKLTAEIQVTDYLTCKQRHFVEIHWHFSEECDIQIQEKCVAVRNNDVELEMSMPQGGWYPELVSGREDPPLGWISRSFDEKLPASCLRWAGEICGSTELRTLINLSVL